MKKCGDVSPMCPALYEECEGGPFVVIGAIVPQADIKPGYGTEEAEAAVRVPREIVLAGIEADLAKLKAERDEALKLLQSANEWFEAPPEWYLAAIKVIASASSE